MGHSPERRSRSRLRAMRALVIQHVDMEGPARIAELCAARPAAPPGGTFSPLTLTDRQARLVFWLAVMAS